MAKTLSIRPLHDRVVIKPAETKEQKSASGIIIPDQGKEKPVQGEVVAVGPGRFDDTGKRIPMEVKAGDKVYFKKPWDEPVKVNGEEYYVLSESEITLIIK